MNWFLWTYLVIAILDVVVKILTIGQPRGIQTPGTVALDSIVNGLIAYGVIYYGSRP